MSTQFMEITFQCPECYQLFSKVFSLDAFPLHGLHKPIVIECPDTTCNQSIIWMRNIFIPANDKESL
jgi:hypothetical protein